MSIILFFIILFGIIRMIWANMNNGNDPKNVPNNKFLHKYMEWHLKYLNMKPTYKKKIESYVLKYGTSILITTPIILLILFFVTIYFEFNFNIISFMFFDSDSYKWFSFSVAFGTLIFGIHKFRDENKIIIGTDVAIYKNNVKVQFISRKPNLGFVKMIGHMDIFQDGGLILDDKHLPEKLYNKWISYNEYLSKYGEWQCVKGYGLKNFIIMDENNMINMEHIIKFVKCFAIVSGKSDKDLYFAIHYELNHKYLSRSVQISVDEIEHKALNNITEPTDLDIRDFKEEYWYHK